MARFLAITSLAWYIKPLAGLISDQFPLFGSRRKYYLVLAALGGAVSWLAAGAMHSSATSLLITMVVVNLFAVLGNTVTGGLLIDFGRRHGRMGKISSLRVIAMNFVSLIVGPLGGWLAGQAFAVTCGIGAALMLMLLAFVALTLQSDAKQHVHASVAERRASVLSCIRSWPVWAVIIYSCAIYLSPSSSTVLYYYQHDVLSISDQMIGFLSAANCAAAMLSGYLYYKFCNRFELKFMLLGGVMISAVSGLLYRFYTSIVMAFIVESIVGACVMMLWLPVQELAARASPSQSGAFTYAFILGLANMAISASDILGTEIVARFSLSLAELGILNTVYLVSTLVLVPLIPRALLGREPNTSA
jgi:Na+/melibiose symporter-like transporter